MSSYGKRPIDFDRLFPTPSSRIAEFAKGALGGISDRVCQTDCTIAKHTSRPPKSSDSVILCIDDAVIDAMPHSYVPECTGAGCQNVFSKYSSSLKDGKHLFLFPQKSVVQLAAGDIKKILLPQIKGWLCYSCHISVQNVTCHSN